MATIVNRPSGKWQATVRKDGHFRIHVLIEAICIMLNFALLKPFDWSDPVTEALSLTLPPLHVPAPLPRPACR